MVDGDTRKDDAFTFHDGGVRAVLDLRVYRLIAIQKTSYKFAAKLSPILGPMVGDTLTVDFAVPSSMSREEAMAALRGFFEELLDQELREKISDETHAIRALIIAQAFSKTDLIRRD
jgi:His-Xaa-Ser system protein HxsD